MDIGAIIINVVTFASGSLSLYLVTLYFDRRKRSADVSKILADIRKLNAEAENIEVETSLNLVAELSNQVDRLREELKQEKASRIELEKKYKAVNDEFTLLQSRVGVLIRGVYALGEQVKQETGKIPVFVPPANW